MWIKIHSSRSLVLIFLRFISTNCNSSLVPEDCHSLCDVGCYRFVNRLANQKQVTVEEQNNRYYSIFVGHLDSLFRGAHYCFDSISIKLIV